jgi:release factor glutamine methyltransferase
MDVGEALGRARRALAPSSATAAGDAQRLVAEAVGRSTAWVLGHPEERLAERQAAWLDQALEQCAAGQPLAYVLGWWEFYGRRFRVSPVVLIPRPETESLVDRVLGFLRSHPHVRDVADVGTGSGCVAVTLASEAPDIRVVAVDISRPALEIARANARVHGVDGRIRWVLADLLSSFRAEWDVVVANLPYIPRPRLAHLEVARHEPLVALDGGEDGLQTVRRLADGLAGMLRPGGLAALEIDEGQGEVLRPLLASALGAAEVKIEPDLSGLERFVTVVNVDPQ